MRRLIPTAAALLGLLAGCGPDAHPAAAVGDPRRGEVLVTRLGCGSCHQIPGVAGATGRVGPPLGGVASRTVIAGVLPNTPPNMIAWLEHPQAVTPNNAMPDMGLGDRDARDIAAYLYTLR